MKPEELFSQLLNKIKRYFPYISKENTFSFFNVIFYDIFKIQHLNGSRSYKYQGVMGFNTANHLRNQLKNCFQLDTNFIVRLKVNNLKPFI